MALARALCSSVMRSMNELTTVHSTHSSVPKHPLVVVRPLPVIHEIPVVGIAATQISFSAKEIPPCKNRGADLGLMRVATPQNRSTTSKVRRSRTVKATTRRAWLRATHSSWVSNSRRLPSAPPIIFDTISS